MGEAYRHTFSTKLSCTVQFLFTLSCADTRFTENFTSLLQDHNITYEQKDGNEHCFIDGQLLDDFLAENESKHEFIRRNILTATRNFDHRLKHFIKNIVMSKFNEMHTQYYNYRIEFQMRGAAHVHGVLWIDFDAFHADKRNQEFNGLKEAMDAIGNENPLTDEEENVIARFADKFITCTLKDPDTRDIVEEVNTHHHTRACRKYNSSICRFAFPRYPATKTLVSIPARIRYKDECVRDEIISRAKCTLKLVRDVLIDAEKINEICKKYPVDMDRSSNKDYLEMIQKQRLPAVLRESKVDKLLKIQRDLKLPEDLREDRFCCELIHQYHEMLKISTGGYKIILKRDIDELYVNNYNKEWIRTWNANMDLQITLDHFAIITYISDYMLKDDTGTMEFIMKALKDTESQELRERLKTVKNTFLTHRQIGEAEAYYRLIPSLNLSGSNCTTLYIHTGFRQNRSVFLKSLSEEEAKVWPKEKVVTVSGKPGKFFTKAISVEDRYDERPEDLQFMSLAQFAKRLTKSSKKSEYDNDELFEAGSDVVIQEELENEDSKAVKNGQDIESVGS